MLVLLAAVVLRQRDHDGAALAFPLGCGIATPPGKFPFARPIEPSPTERFRADAVWAMAQALCIGKSIDPALVTSRQEIGDFFRHLASGHDTSQSPIMKGWRREALGQPLTDLLTKSGTVSLAWDQGQLRVV